MNWIPLESISQLDKIKTAQGHCVIFKHSTRCSISLMAKKHLEAEWGLISDEIPAYFIDLLKTREVSGAVAEQFEVKHESPQLLLIKDGKCVYHSSHGEISAADVAVRVVAEV